MITLQASLAMVGIAAITVVGDYFLKLASLESRAFQNKWFAAGCLIYAFSALGWVYAMQHMKLATIGVVYSLATLLLLAVLGLFAFGETLNRYEIVGIAFAVAAIILLGRFGG